MGDFLARLLLFLLLFGFWFGLSGQTKPLLLAEGLITCALVVGYLARAKATIWNWSPRAILTAIVSYLPWLLLQIVRSNLRVTYLTLHPSLPISPCAVRIPCTLRTPFGRAIYANSITLTPGTVSVLIDDEGILVHALTAADAESLRDGAMHARIERLEALA